MAADETHDLPDIARRAADGDQQAFRSLVERTQAPIYRLALRTTGSRADADDVVQETYVRVWDRLGELRDHQAVLGWMCRICRNAAYDRHRRRGRRRAVSLDATTGGGDEDGRALVDRLESDDAGPEESTSSHQLAGRVRDALAGLKEKHRVVLLLREIDGLAYEEIAEALGISIGTVESRIHRARKALARKLRGLAGELAQA